jgi:signal transduction histidine kinase
MRLYRRTWFNLVNKRAPEFYIGLFIWLLEIAISYSMWFAGDDLDIRQVVSSFNIALVAFLYGLYIVGYLTSYGIFQRRLTRKMKVLGLVLSSVATLGLSMFFFFGMVALLSTMIIIQLAGFIEKNRALLVAVLVPVLCVLIDIWLGKAFEYTIIIIYGTFNLLALFTSYRFIAENKAKQESEQLVRELRATQILLSATTKRDERLRIARDLHDLLGHQLTALSLQLEVASHVETAAIQKHVLQAKAICGLLLSDVRETVSEIRQKKDLELREALTALIQGLPEIEIDLIIEDEPQAGARQVEVIFRCVQEALTNIAKHANASHCKIKLSNIGQYIELSVEDDGCDNSEIKPGNGLTGMAERVAEIDGRLDYQNTTDGFVLCVKLPNYS